MEGRARLRDDAIEVFAFAAVVYEDFQRNNWHGGAVFCWRKSLQTR